MCKSFHLDSTMSSQINFEGNLISINNLPSDAICIAGVWYCDPSKVPKEYRAALLRFPSVQNAIRENKSLSPEVQEAIKLRAESVKKKQKQLGRYQEQPTVNVVAPVDVSVKPAEEVDQVNLVNMLATKKKKN